MRARAVVAAGLLLGALPLTPATAEPRCDIELDHPTRGASAVSALGADLPEVARAAGFTATRLEQTLKTDSTLWLDECARPYYVEPADPAPDTDGADPAGADDALALHSRPGSALTIYLDFDGHDPSGTAWTSSYGDFTAEAYSLDSDPAFSATELTRIAGVWQRVAEDYAPFDVDVTTKDPGEAAITRSSSGDTVYGTRVVISPTNSIYSDCSCGGVAYVGVFDTPSSHSYFQPAWVFTRGVGTGSKSIAEAASHEAGHNLGLRHDGNATSAYYSGHGVWAPIMGVGYYKPLSQWSRGEYTGANNPEDDLAIISSNGPTPITDDVADGRASAVDIQPGTTSGEISTRADVDWFRFTASGPTTVSVDPVSAGGNLDVRLGVYNDDGSEVVLVDPLSTYVSSDSASGLSAATTLSLPAGTYLANVEGVGAGSVSGTGYSDYGSLGRYTLTLATTTQLLITADPPGGVVETPYSAALTASGGEAPYTWQVTSGALPAGLTLTSDGVLQGTPTRAGDHQFDVRVTDHANISTTTEMTLAILAPYEPPQADPGPPAPPISAPPTPPPASGTASPPTATAVRITTSRLPRAAAGRKYRTRLSAIGSGQITWTATKPARGMRLHSNGVLRGVPITPGRYRVQVRARDSAGHTATAILRLRVRR